jgi:hypothetical protein
MTTLRGIISSFDRSTPRNSFGAKAKAISDQLNIEWDPAWNVVLVYNNNGKNYDTVMYGYGFNGHWFWFNGVKLNNADYASFIIWKDYNCFQWMTFDPFASGFKPWTFTNAIYGSMSTTLKGGKSGRDAYDIWLVAKDLQEKVVTASNLLFPDNLAYTVIASQNNNAQFYGRFCIKDHALFDGVARLSGVDAV